MPKINYRRGNTRRTGQKSKSKGRGTKGLVKSYRDISVSFGNRNWCSCCERSQEWDRDLRCSTTRAFWKRETHGRLRRHSDKLCRLGEAESMFVKDEKD